MFNIVLSLALLISSALSHGFLVNPTGQAEAMKIQTTWGYSNVKASIDKIRSPLLGDSLCRGETSGSGSTALKLVNGQPLTLTFAISIGAQHIGPCSVYIMQKGDKSSEVLISTGGENCISEGALNTNKAGDSSVQCPNSSKVPLLVQPEMCMQEWTFNVANADKVKCTDCVLRWYWEAKHTSPSELFENCASVTIGGAGSNSGTSPGYTAPESDSAATTIDPAPAQATNLPSDAQVTSAPKPYSNKPSGPSPGPAQVSSPSSQMPVTNKVHSTRHRGKCGSKNGIECATGFCCSHRGYCGTSDAYCALGCQEYFGECN